MSKIVIRNDSRLDDATALKRVSEIIKDGNSCCAVVYTDCISIAWHRKKSGRIIYTVYNSI